jgi:hypothetical protein
VTLLTKEEQGVINLLATAYNAFVELPKLHDWHQQEFMMAIHDAQHLVMIRPEIRARETDDTP